MAVGDMDEAALRIGVLQRMQQRELPSGEQRDDQNNPRETGEQASSPERLR